MSTEHTDDLSNNERCTSSTVHDGHYLRCVRVNSHSGKCAAELKGNFVRWNKTEEAAKSLRLTAPDFLTIDDLPPAIRQAHDDAWKKITPADLQGTPFVPTPEQRIQVTANLLHNAITEKQLDFNVVEEARTKPDPNQIPALIRIANLLGIDLHGVISLS